jgi:hypothetical protein
LTIVLGDATGTVTLSNISLVKDEHRPSFSARAAHPRLGDPK